MCEENCVFCKIAKGDIPSKVLYEDDEFKVILDLGPATKGHALILPKNHYRNLYEIPDEAAGKVMLLAKKMALHMTEKLNCDGFNLVQNNGEAAGQTVFHFHLHLIPRYQHMKNKDILIWNHETFTEEEMKEICQELR